MAENLIFRKGLQASLAALPIKPGAISITIDEPGMYIDLPANAALGHANDYRVRIGDVITVQTIGELADLQNLTPKNLSDDGGTTSLSGRISEYSSSALYYVADKNMLLKYNSQSGKFVWINDTSSLQSQITSINSTVTNHGTRLETLEGKVGSAKSGNVAATGLYKEIEDAKADLEEQIAGILGGGSGLTLESVDAAIKQEVKDRTAADTVLDGKITGLGSRVDTAESNITGINTLIGSADETNTSTVFGKINQEKTRAEGAESALSTRIKAIEDLKIEETYAKDADLTSVNTNLGKLQGTVSDLTTTVTNNKNAIEKALADEQARAERVEGGLDDRIEAIENLKINDTYATKASVSGLSGRVDDVEELIGDANDTAADATVYGAIAKEAQRAGLVEEDLIDRVGVLETNAPNYALKTELSPVATKANNNATAISDLGNTLANDYYKKSETYNQTKINELVNGAKGDAAKALTDAKAYTDTREAAIKAAYEGADADLEVKIQGIQSTLEKVATDEELTKAVADLTEDIATAKAGAITDATAAAKSYTDTREGEITKAYQAADKVLDEKIAGLTNSKANASDVYTKNQIDTKLKDINDEIDGLPAAWASDISTAVSTSAETLTGKIDKVSGDLSAYKTTVGNTYETKEDATAKLNAAKADATEKANAAKSGAVADAQAYTDAEVSAEATLRANADDALDKKIQGVSSNLTNNYYTSAQIDAKKFATETYADTAAQNAVKEVLRAAEAMRYMGTLTSTDPMAEAIAKSATTEAGDVWVVASISNDGTYKPGDMLIAKDDKADTAAKWTHVKTGYDASLEQKLFTEAATNGGKITLDSIGTLDTGSIEIKADLNSAVRVTMTTDNTAAGNHGVATIGMVWEDF